MVIGRDSDALRLLQYLRNEAHRFGITFHRNQRSKGFIKSELDEIPNIGEATIKKLIDKFKSVNVDNKNTYLGSAAGCGAVDKLFERGSVWQLGEVINRAHLAELFIRRLQAAIEFVKSFCEVPHFGGALGNQPQRVV